MTKGVLRWGWVVLAIVATSCAFSGAASAQEPNAWIEPPEMHEPSSNIYVPSPKESPRILEDALTLSISTGLLVSTPFVSDALATDRDLAGSLESSAVGLFGTFCAGGGALMVATGITFAAILAPYQAIRGKKYASTFVLSGVLLASLGTALVFVAPEAFRTGAGVEERIADDAGKIALASTAAVIPAVFAAWGGTELMRWLRVDSWVGALAVSFLAVSVANTGYMSVRSAL